MPIKGTIKKDAIRGDAYAAEIDDGAGTVREVTYTMIGEIEEEVPVIELPDGTKASGGRTTVEPFDVKIPMHHTEDYAFMEAWYKQCNSDPIPPTAYREMTVTMTSNSGTIERFEILEGVWIHGRTSAEKSMGEGQDTFMEITYKMCVDSRRADV